MERWKYDIADFGGVELRRLIAEATESGDLGDGAAVIENLLACLKVIRLKLQNEKEDTQEVDDLIDLIDGEADLVRTNSPLIAEFGFNLASDLIDERLSEFYDICDAKRVWIGS